MADKVLDMEGLSYVLETVKGSIAEKVDKETGKQLSTNDFTDPEKAKLAALADYIHPTTPGNKHIPEGGAAGQFLKWSGDGTAEWAPDNNTTYTDMKGATYYEPGESGLVPAPEAGTENMFLGCDGTWRAPMGTTYDNANSALDGLMSKEDKIKLDTIDRGAQSNLIEVVKVNNIPVSILNKTVNIDLANYATKADVSSIYKVKGSKNTLANLPATGNVIGDVWNIDDTGANYVWTGSDWDKLSETVDLSGYLQKTDIVFITREEIDALMAI